VTGGSVLGNSVLGIKPCFLSFFLAFSLHKEWQAGGDEEEEEEEEGGIDILDDMLCRQKFKLALPNK
jgi:hypothetical protein